MPAEPQITPWWQGAVIYQIYPRSFQDTNGDGVGDLKGITKRLDYIAKLGVDAIWISPFVKSPMKDFGYDVACYKTVDPLFGTLEDFDDLIGKAHQLGLKVLTDQVLNHTSSEHAWFQESRKDKKNPRSNWYVWVDPTSDGKEPNNWLSQFGGSAWEWDETRQQYYLHHFLDCQPDLNFHEPEVIQASLDVMKFWLDRGVDGFRFDVVNYYVHDKALRDNPLRLSNEEGAEGAPDANPYSRQFHLYDKTQPENLNVLKQFRTLLNEYPDRTSVGEVGDDHSIKTASQYVQGNEHLHMVYTFQFLDASSQFNSTLIEETIANVEEAIGDGWICWSFSNHDVPRAATRLSHTNPSDEYSKILMALLLSLRGSVCLYQGEELGLTEAIVPYEKMQDPYGLNFYPDYLGRDGCRTPIPWSHNENYAGFTSNEPWLPIPEEHKIRAIDIQEGNKESILNAYRIFIHWRKKQSALINGDIQFIKTNQNNLLAFERRSKDQHLLILINLSGENRTFSLTQYPNLNVLRGHGFSELDIRSEMILLQPYQAFYARIPI